MPKKHKRNPARATKPAPDPSQFVYVEVDYTIHKQARVAVPVGQTLANRDLDRIGEAIFRNDGGEPGINGNVDRVVPTLPLPPDYLADSLVGGVFRVVPINYERTKSYLNEDEDELGDDEEWDDKPRMPTDPEMARAREKHLIAALRMLRQDAVKAITTEEYGAGDTLEDDEGDEPF